MICSGKPNLNSQATWAGAENRMAATTIRETTFSLSVYNSAPSQISLVRFPRSQGQSKKLVNLTGRKECFTDLEMRETDHYLYAQKYQSQFLWRPMWIPKPVLKLLTYPRYNISLYLFWLGLAMWLPLPRMGRHLIGTIQSMIGQVTTSIWNK